MKIFSLYEILEMALVIEKEGAEFYRQAAKLVPDPSASDMLLSLSKMEEEHRKYFEFMRSEFSPEQRETALFDSEGEYAEYARTIAAGKIFDSAKAALLSGDSSDILRRALELEKDTVIFYVSFLNAMSDRKEGQGLLGIIKEEMGHINGLNKALASLKR